MSSSEDDSDRSNRAKSPSKSMELADEDLRIGIDISNINPHISSKSFQHKPYIHQPPFSPYMIVHPSNIYFHNKHHHSMQTPNIIYLQVIPILKSNLH